MLVRMWKKENTYLLVVRMQTSIAIKFWFLRILVTDLPQDSAILLLGLYAKNCSPYFRNTCSTMFIDALFIITKNWPWTTT